MDLNETTKEVLNRHPWELSRTKCVLNQFAQYLGDADKVAVYANIGAGDLYFDRALQERYVKHRVYAVDIAYKSLEYMERDAAYVKKISREIKSGGYFFFTLPAFPILFSAHDINVKNLRRYNRKSFAAILKEIPELEIIEEYYFYTSLFLIRFIQKLLHIPIDPGHKVTANWSYADDTWITRILNACLNLDFSINKIFSKLGIYFPGLSMMAICRKK